MCGCRQGHLDVELVGCCEERFKGNWSRTGLVDDQEREDDHAEQGK